MSVYTDNMIAQRKAAGQDFTPTKYTGPRLFGIFNAAADAEQARLAEEAQARREARTPREIWLSTLTWQDRKHIGAWETVNGMQYPMPE